MLSILLELFFYSACTTPLPIASGCFSVETAMIESLYLSGVTVEYTCNIGFRMFPEHNNTIFCNEFGKWVGNIGDCYPGLHI